MPHGLTIVGPDAFQSIARYAAKRGVDHPDLIAFVMTSIGLSPDDRIDASKAPPAIKLVSQHHNAARSSQTDGPIIKIMGNAHRNAVYHALRSMNPGDRVITITRFDEIDDDETHLVEQASHVISFIDLGVQILQFDKIRPAERTEISLEMASNSILSLHANNIAVRRPSHEHCARHGIG